MLCAKLSDSAFSKTDLPPVEFPKSLIANLFYIMMLVVFLEDGGGLMLIKLLLMSCSLGEPSTSLDIIPPWFRA